MHDVLSLSLVSFALATSISPGPNNLMLLASGLNFGPRATWPHVLGVVSGFALLLTVAGMGLARALAASPGLQLALKLAAAAYMLWLAWRIASAAPPKDDDAPARARPMRCHEAVLFQWINPKGWAMALGALALYVPPGGGLAEVLEMAAVYALVMLPSNLFWVVLGAQLQRLLRRPRWRRAFNIAIALLLVAALLPIIAAPALPGP